MRGARFRVLALIGASMLVLTACGGDDGGGSTGSTGGGASATPAELGGEITISNWDAYMPKDLIPNFEAETGVTVNLVNHTTNEDLMGKLTAQNGGGYDLVFASGPFVQSMIQQGWAAPIDPAQIPNLENLYPEASELGYDPGNTHSVPYTWGTTGLCYRTDLVSQAPTSWDVFRSPPSDLEGKMTMLGTDRWLLQPALLTLGYSINTTDQAQIDEATQWTIDAKQNLLAFDDTTFYSKLVEGEASLVQAWDGWCNYGIAEDPQIEFVVPEQGSDVWTDAMVVMESSENKAAAHAFIDYVLTPEVGAAVAQLVLYKVPNQPAMESLPAKLLKTYPNMEITPQELLQQEPEEDLGTEGTAMWADAVTQIKSS